MTGSFFIDSQHVYMSQYGRTVKFLKDMTYSGVLSSDEDFFMPDWRQGWTDGKKVYIGEVSGPALYKAPASAFTDIRSGDNKCKREVTLLFVELFYFFFFLKALKDFLSLLLLF